MTHKERTERAKNAIMLAGLKLFGDKGFAGTTVTILEKETGFTRGSFFTHYKNMYDIFVATVNRYYFSRITACSVPEEFRGTLKNFYTKLISMLENECIEMLGKGVRHLSKAYMIIEREALQNIPDFKNWYEESMREQAKVWETVVSNAVHSGEISSKGNVKEIAQLFWFTLAGHIIDSSIKGNVCYTDGLAYQLNNLYEMVTRREVCAQCSTKLASCK